MALSKSSISILLTLGDNYFVVLPSTVNSTKQSIIRKGFQNIFLHFVKAISYDRSGHLLSTVLISLYFLNKVFIRGKKCLRLLNRIREFSKISRGIE